MLTLTLFGSFTAKVDGIPIPKPTRRKALELLARLAIERGRSYDRAYLAEQLWLDEPDPAKALDKLRHALTNLRQILGSHANCITATGNKSLRLNPDYVQTDYWEFEECLKSQQGQRALHLAKHPLLAGWSAEWIDVYRNDVEKRVNEVGEQVIDNPLAVLHLPLPLTELVGRDSVQHDLKVQLSTRRLVTLVGVGGVGKTHLALSVAEMLHGEGMTAVFVDFSVLENPQHLPITVATVLGEGKAAATDWLTFLTARLRGHTLLLVLDNCEHVLEPTISLVQQLMVAAPGLRFLVTSRERLGIPGEKVVTLEPLTTFASSGQSDACRLLSDRVNDLLSDWKPDAGETVHLEAITTRLEGIPLALELIASAVARFGAKAVNGDLEATLHPFDYPQKGRTARHSTLRASLEWSLKQRSSEERAYFRGLCVFRGSFDVEAAAAVLSISHREARACLDALMNCSLITRPLGKNNPGRWRLLESLRQYGKEELVALGEQDIMDARHLDHFRGRAIAAQKSLSNNAQVEAMAALAPDLENLRATVSYALRTPQAIPAALELLHHAYRFWFLQALYEEFYTSIESLLQEADKHRIEIALPLRLDVLDEAAGLAFTGDQFERARGFYHGELALAQTSTDELLSMNALYGLALLSNVEGQYKEAHTIQERVLRAREQEGNLFNIATAHNGLGITMTRLGKYDLARQHLETSLHLKETELRWTTKYVDTLYNLMVVEMLTRQWERFAELSKQLRITINHLGDNAPEIESNFQNLFGVVLCEQGAFAEAKAIHEQAYAFFLEREQSRAVADSLLGLGRACLPLGEWVRCDDALHEAQTRFEAVCDFRRVAECQEQRALLRAQQMQLDEAAAWLEKADALRAKIASPVPPLDQDKIQDLRQKLMEAIRQQPLT